MSTDDHLQSINRLTETVTDAAKRASIAAQDAAKRAGVVAQDAAHNVKERASATLTKGESYVRANPIPTIFGALALGIAIGYALNRREPELSFARRHLGEPLDHAKEAVAAALAPVAAKLYKEYKNAKSKGEDALGTLDDYSHSTRKSADHVLKDLRRFSSNLKFW